MAADSNPVTTSTPSPADLAAHLERGGAAYRDRFTEDEAAEHFKAIAQLSNRTPCQVLVSTLPDDRVSCTVVAFDHAFEFSLITGVLAGLGFRVERGAVFTLPPVTGAGSAASRVTDGVGSGGVRPGGWSRKRRFTARRTIVRDARAAAVSVDQCEGAAEHGAELSRDQWLARLRETLTETVGLLDRGEPESIEAAKTRVNELVTDRLADLEQQPAPDLFPDTLEVASVEDRRYRLRVDAQDTPAFLYALSTALSLQGLVIENVAIHNLEGRVRDELLLRDPVMRGVGPLEMVERIRLSVVLTKQFTYFLVGAPNPFTALSRFEQLAEDIVSRPDRATLIERLRSRRVMENLAKLLGTSDYLWNDFIKGHYDALAPIFEPERQRGRRFCEPMETLPQRLEQALAGAVGLAEQRDRLNRFKDRELFLVDLDHILTPGAGFQELSLRLTMLAEVLFARAARLVYEDLVRSYGEPRARSGGPAHYGLFGLGKFGGVALGYASDLELLFLYDSLGQSTGGKRSGIENTQFFETLAQETTQFIRTKREGIFEVDLRLRPYGRDGTLASSLDQFQTYYSVGGPSHDFERLALVRLRWFAGDPRLGATVERLRDQIVADPAAVDLDRLWDIWSRHREQKMARGGRNAKHSPGALVDLETLVQLLQIQHVETAPQLRTPRISEALQALRRASVLSPDEFAVLSGGYQFFRRLINALRIQRGNARDLFLPPTESDECLHLARRMGYHRLGKASSAERLVEEFETRRRDVIAVVTARAGRKPPGAEQ